MVFEASTYFCKRSIGDKAYFTLVQYAFHIESYEYLSQTNKLYALTVQMNLVSRKLK